MCLNKHLGPHSLLVTTKEEMGLSPYALGGPCACIPLTLYELGSYSYVFFIKKKNNQPIATPDTFCSDVVWVKTMKC